MTARLQFGTRRVMPEIACSRCRNFACKTPLGQELTRNSRFIHTFLDPPGWYLVSVKTRFVHRKTGGLN